MSEKFTCTCCHQDKEENEFYISFVKKRKKMIRSAYCKVCIKAKNDKKKPQIKAYNQKYYIANREEIIENCKIYNALFK